MHRKILPSALLLLLVAITLFFLVAPRLSAIYRDDAGWPRLAAQLGENVPTGQGIQVSMVESLVGNHYGPDPDNMDFSGKSIEFLSGETGVSEHATITGLLFFGNTFSIAPGIETIRVYQTNNWMGGGFLRVTGDERPAVETSRIQNHSWTGGFPDQAMEIEANRRLDYAITRDGFLAVTGMQNVSFLELRGLMSHGYNTLAVGRVNGDHNRGGTRFDEPGRVKPDLVAPEDLGMSNPAPIVSAAAALLLEEADRTPGLENARHHPQVIKSVLMAGAAKAPFPEWQRNDHQPIDEVFGAGRLNVYHSHRILTGGEHAPANDGFVPSSGWHLGDTASGDSAVYFLSLDADQETFTANLTWHRLFDLEGADFQNAEPLVARLELRLFESDGFTLGDEVQISTDPVNNVQHLYIEDLPAGEYALRIDVIDDPTPDGTPYALAWNAIPVPPPPPTFAEWQDKYFTPEEIGEPAISGPQADPAGDGLPNLLVFALAGNPNESNRHRPPSPGMEAVDDEVYLTFTYTRPQEIEGVTYRIDASTDLVSWAEDIGILVDVTIHGNGTVTRTYRDSEPLAGQPKRFLKLTVLGDSSIGE